MQRLKNEHRYDEIREAVVNLIEDYGIRSYPFSVVDLIERIGIKLIKYSSLPNGVQSMLLALRPNALTRIEIFQGTQSVTIFYNDAHPITRIRFTLAHELAHVVLGHINSDADQLEAEADIFANYLLGPAPIVIRDSCNSAEAIMEDFNVGYKCARSIQDRTANRIRCGKPMTEYEHVILDLCYVERRDRISCI